MPTTENGTKRPRDTTVAAVIALLAESFPKCFSVYQPRRRPLKLKIHLDIQAGLNGVITPAELHKALGTYCSNPVYLGHTRKGAWRLDLDGQARRGRHRRRGSTRQGHIGWHQSKE